MLREEELSGTPFSDDFGSSEKKKPGEKEFSFIQNRVPSPLNNNFLLSAAQSPHGHVRQTSETFMTGNVGINQVNQEDFKLGTFISEMEQNEEEKCLRRLSEGQSNLEDSKITLFTQEGAGNGMEVNTSRILEAQQYTEDKIQVQLVTESNYESNNFNYSESNYALNGPSSIGTFTQGEGKGSQIFQYKSQAQCMGGRESVVTPALYDENSLLNLSNTPSMMRTSNLTRGLIKDERIISSTKLNPKQISTIQEKVEEQEESILPIQSQKYNKDFFQNKIQKYQKPNPLEMPLQRKLEENKNSNQQSHSPWLMGLQNSNKENLQVLFSRGKDKDQKNQSNNQQQTAQSEPNLSEEEVLFIKKKLDFSRMSSLAQLQTPSNHLMNGFQQQSSLMKQSNQNISIQTFNEPHINFSYYNVQDTERILGSFQQDKAAISKKYSTQSLQRYQSDSEGTTELKKHKEFQYTDEKPQNSSPNYKNRVHSTRPPLLKNSQKDISVVTKAQPQVELQQTQNFDTYYFNGLVNGENLQIPLQVPPQSRTNSTNSYNASIVDTYPQIVPAAPINRNKEIQQFFKNFENDTPNIMGYHKSGIETTDQNQSCVTQRSAIPAASDLFLQAKLRTFQQDFQSMANNTCSQATIRDRMEAISDSHREIQMIPQVHKLKKKPTVKKSDSSLQSQKLIKKPIKILQTERSESQSGINRALIIQNENQNKISHKNSNTKTICPKVGIDLKTTQQLKSTFQITDFNKTKNFQYANQAQILSQQVQSVRSIPVSSTGSQQNSFMQNQTQPLKGKKIVKKSKKNNCKSDENSKVAKKNKSVMRSQIPTDSNNSMQTLKNKSTKTKGTRNLSKAKGVKEFSLGFMKQPSQTSLGINKENIKPDPLDKRSNKNIFSLIQGNQRAKPQTILQSFDNFSSCFSKDAIDNQSSQKQFQGLFHTMDPDQFRTMMSNDQSRPLQGQGQEVQSDIDNYYNFSANYSKRYKVRANSKRSHKSKKSGVSLNRLQSPYNSKKIKNKFSNKNSKPSSSRSSVQRTCEEEKEHDTCKRCTELIKMLKTTRFLVR